MNIQDDYNILFQRNCIRELNDYLSSVKPFLFFAAGWTPKPMVSGENALNFRIAVTNGYGLFKDCANYLPWWIDYITKQGAIDVSDKKRIISLINKFTDLRTLFSHNQDENSISTQKKIEKVKRYLKDKYNIDVCSSIPLLLQVSGEVFLDIIEELCVETKHSVMTVEKAIREITDNKRDVKEEYWEPWCDFVALWYMRSNNIVYQVAKDAEKLYSHSFDSHHFLSWYKKQKEQENRNRIRNVIKEMSEPAYPYIVMHQFILKYYIDGGDEQ